MASNAITNLINNRNTIRRLMTMDSNGEMSKIVENNVKNGNLRFSEEGVSYTPKKNLNENRLLAQKNVVVNEEIMKKSKLPKSVLESFQKEPGEPFSLDAPVQTSVLDGLDLQTLEELREETSKKPVINEERQNQGGFIDYSLLRTIINEAVQENVKKYVSAMTKKLMTESTKTGNSIQAIKVGDKFSFITENGDVYEATLKFKTNINTKGKKEKVIQ